MSCLAVNKRRVGTITDRKIMKRTKKKKPPIGSCSRNPLIGSIVCINPATYRSKEVSKYMHEFPQNYNHKLRPSPEISSLKSTCKQRDPQVRILRVKSHVPHVGGSSFPFVQSILPVFRGELARLCFWQLSVCTVRVTLASP